MMDTNDPKRLNRFLVESAENLNIFESGLLEFEKNINNSEHVDSLFRAMHSIKGISSFFTFNNLERLSHKAEKILSIVRDSSSPREIVDEDLISILLQVNDFMHKILDNIQEHGNDGLDDTDKLMELLTSWESRINFVQAPMKATTYKPRKRRKLNQAQLDMLKDLGALNQEDINHQKQESVPEAKSKKKKRKRLDESIKVNISTLNRISSLIEELVVTNNSIQKIAGEREILDQCITDLSRITVNIRDSMMQTKLQPLSDITMELTRTLRDVALELGKKVDLDIEGDETELDKNVLEKISDPLIHMVRNALDHGIETPEERTKVGKDETGLIKLKAYHSGAWVYISIIDDGKGIDLDYVKDKAVASGLHDREELETMSEQEILDIIFEAGFSTKDNISNMSGRGVGMDVVKSNIQNLNGEVEISSSKGKGTEVTLKVPLTLAITKVAIVTIDDQKYAIPESVIHSFQTIEHSDFIDEADKCYVMNGDNKLDVVFGREFADQRNDKAKCLEYYSKAEFIDYIQISDEGYNYAFVVDSIEDMLEIVVRPVSSNFDDSWFYSGSTVLTDFTVALILDMSTVAAYFNINRESSLQKIVINDEAEVAAESSMSILFELDGERFLLPLETQAKICELKLEDIEESVLGNFAIVEGRYTRVINLCSLLSDKVELIDRQEYTSVLYYEYENNPLAVYLGRAPEFYRQGFELIEDSDRLFIKGTVDINGNEYSVVNIDGYIKQLIDGSESLRADNEVIGPSKSGFEALSFRYYTDFGDILFAVKLNNIEEVVSIRELSEVRGVNDIVKGLLNLRGNILVSKSLPEILGLGKKESVVNESIVIKIAREMFSLEVGSLNEIIYIENDAKLQNIQDLPVNILEFTEEVYNYKDQLVVMLDSKKLLDIYSASVMS